MTGGAGNDVYIVDAAWDFDLGQRGSDRAYVSADWTLGAGVAIEKLFVNTSAGVTLAGNELADNIDGGAGMTIWWEAAATTGSWRRRK